MKERKSFSLLVLILIISLVLVIVSVATMLIIKKGSTEKTNINNTNSSVNTTYEENQKNNENKVSTSNKNFWIDTYNTWKKQKDECPLVLFNEKCTTPINFKTLNNFINRYDYNVLWDGVNVIDTKRNTQDINDIINSEEMIGSSTTIWMYYEDLNTFTNYGYKNSLKVDIKNYNYNYRDTSGDISLKDAINQNWWYIKNDYSDPTISLGIDIADDSYDDATNAIPLLNEVIEILGGPKHIYVFDKTLQDDHQQIRYWLSYEYDEFILTVEVKEASIGDYYQCGIKSVNYFTKESFVKELDEKSQLDDFEIMK